MATDLFGQMEATMGRFNVGEHVLIMEGTEALRSFQGKKGKVVSSSEQYFGWVYEIRLDEPESSMANSINEAWLQLVTD